MKPIVIAFIYLSILVQISLISYTLVVLGYFRLILDMVEIMLRKTKILISLYAVPRTVYDKDIDK